MVKTSLPLRCISATMFGMASPKLAGEPMTVMRHRKQAVDLTPLQSQTVSPVAACSYLDLLKIYVDPRCLSKTLIPCLCVACRQAPS